MVSGNILISTFHKVSLERHIMLIPNAHYEDLDASAAGIAPQKTIVVQSKGSKKMLIFGILWTTFWTLAFG